MTDRFFDVSVGGDIAFLNGVLKYVLEKGWEDHVFIDGFTSGCHETAAQLAAQSWESLERGSGASREQMLGLAHMLSEAKTAVFVWSMGVAQHSFREQTQQGRWSTSLFRAWLRRTGKMRPHAHRGPFGHPRRGGYGRLRDGVPGGPGGKRGERPAFVPALGLPCPCGPGAHGPGDGRCRPRGAPGRLGLFRREFPRSLAPTPVM